MNGRALVVGGGIAGLSVARGLVRGGWEVDVRERLDGPPDIGGALAVWPGALKAFDRLGLGERVRERAVYSTDAALLRPDGRKLLGPRGRVGVHLVSRSVLLGILVGGLADGPVRWNTSATAADILPGEGFDVVIGADGIHSLVRRTVFPHASPPRALGSVAYRGTLPGPVERFTEAWGGGRLFGVTPLDAHNTNWYAALDQRLLTGNERAARDAGTHAEVLRREFGDWGGEVSRVLAGLEAHGVDRRALMDLPSFGPYVRRRHALLGDAAHAMAPNLGRGACESVVDAAVLADALNEEPTVARALSRYDRVRRGPTRRIVAASRLLNRISTTGLTGRPRRPRSGAAVTRPR
ncbi:FAD-dependent monooxygenase [Nocardiopsis ganjiahuensis]|uniref:FAD-dependent monooxygenase n=1 Tax=Nocardiopsis ganjiahuensis TaxID=239984 RepID=UPI00037F359B|nr:FAD-dependent monooxygenase [Nocardiopsis ganjiahuensis]